MATKRLELELMARGEGCLGKAADDEPIFILRAQDITMPLVMGYWIALAEREARGPNVKTKEASKFIGEVVDWQARNKTKAPD